MTNPERNFLIVKARFFQSSPDFLQARWRWRGLIVCHVLALLVLVLWDWPLGRQWLGMLDMQVFHSLNAPLATQPLAAKFWAIASTRLADALAALLMFACIVKSGWIFSAAQVRRALFVFLAALALLLLIRVVPFASLVRFMGWQHSGPSLVVPGAVLLSDLFSGWHAIWEIKDSSARSFPGDHASVLLLWALFLWPFARWGQRLFIAVLCLTFMLPRLVAGAHWAADVLIGGVAVSLLAYGWGCCTPFAVKVADLLERLSAPLLRPLARLPGLRRIALISGR